MWECGSVSVSVSVDEDEDEVTLLMMSESMGVPQSADSSLASSSWRWG